MKKTILGFLCITLLAAILAACSGQSGSSITQVQQAFYEGGNPMVNGVAVPLEADVFDGVFNPILNEESKPLDSLSNHDAGGTIVLSNSNPDVTITILGMWPGGSEYEGKMILCADVGGKTSYYAYDHAVYTKIAEIIARDLP